MVALGYERKKLGELSRLAQFSKSYIFYAASALISCPLAMTDGAARLMEIYASKRSTPLEKELYQYFTHLVSTDPAHFWTSGQHMTERTGGSDVSQSETLAYEQEDGSYKMYGYKFFTSATTSEMAVALARVVDKNGNSVPGSRGLSCFFVRLQRDKDGKLDGLLVHRLKDKLGTKSVPTAELEYVGVKGTLIGDVGRGVPVISNLFNLTRWQNAVWCASAMRRALTLAQCHASVRQVSGGPLHSKPAHLELMASLEVETRAATLLLAHSSVLLGKDEIGTATEAESTVLRMLTPLAKLYTAKQALHVISECIECLGGVGYCEDSGLPQLFRDAQVTPVWEGTTNILSLDVWRPIVKEKGLQHFLGDIERRVSGFSSSIPSHMSHAIRLACKDIASFARTVSANQNALEATARDFSYSLARCYMASLLVEFADFSHNEMDLEIANRWFKSHHLSPTVDPAKVDAKHIDMSRKIALSKL